MSEFWNLLKTDNGVILACFIAGALSLTRDDFAAPALAIICILVCAILIGTIIAIICPYEIRPYVAITIIVVAVLGAPLRLR